MTGRTTELASIQALRGLAALAVVVAHSQAEVERVGLDPFRFSHGQVGVDVFFVVSGFIMVLVSGGLFGRPDAPWLFFERRLKRIAPLYWLTTAIMLAYIALHYGDLASVNLSPASVLGSFLFLPVPRPDGWVVPVHGVGWTLIYEMYFYALFACAVWMPRIYTVLAVAAALSAVVLLGTHGALPGALSTYANPIVFEFVFGMLLALAYARGVRLPLWASLACVALALGGFAAFGDQAPTERFLLLGAPAALLVGGLVLSTTEAPDRPALRWLVALGNASYALYLIHPIVHAMPRWFLPASAITSPWAFLAAIVCLDVAAALLLHRYFERPVARWLATGTKQISSASATDVRPSRVDENSGGATKAVTTGFLT